MKKQIRGFPAFYKKESIPLTGRAYMLVYDQIPNTSRVLYTQILSISDQTQY